MKRGEDFYVFFTEDEFAADEYIQQWVLANDRKNDAFWSQFLTNHPQKRDMLIRARQLVKDLVITTYQANPLSDDEKAFMKRSIYEELNNTVQPGAKYFLLQKKTWLISAAAAAILFILFSAGKMTSQLSVAASEDMAAIFTGTEQTKSIELSDGSSVVLNPNSSFRYSTDFSAHAIREVYLEGNAAFHVKKDSSHKQFIVHANGTSVTVLGTQFIVNARSGATEVMLNSGKVKVSQDNSQTNTAYLVPGEKIKLDTNLNVFIKTKMSTYQYSAWTDHTWNFQQTSLGEISHVLSAYYGVNILFAHQQTSKLRVSALMPVTSLQALIPILEYTLHIKIKENQNYLTIQ